MSEEDLKRSLKIACEIRNGKRVEPTIISDYLYKNIVERMSNEELLDVVLADLRLKITQEKRKELLSAMSKNRL